MTASAVIGPSAAPPPTSQSLTKEIQGVDGRRSTVDGKSKMLRDLEEVSFHLPATTNHRPSAIDSSDLRVIAIGLLVPSETNPRKSFDTPADKELLQSIRLHGVLSPLLVRFCRSDTLKNGYYELVAGERRYRCALKAKLTELPCYVKELTDEQALELQIVENLQRSDITPLEEGAGYAALIASMRHAAEGAVRALPAGERADAWKKHNEKVTAAALVETVAARIGKSVRYVYARMKLVELAPEVKKALAEGKIEASHADEIVRLQPAEQAKALDFCIKDPDGYGKPKNREQAPSVRALKAFCREEAYIDLANGCPFALDDAKLAPAAGACDACPKLTGNNPSFAAQDVGKKVCTDPACYREKCLATVNIECAKIEKAKGVKPVAISPRYLDWSKKAQPGRLYAAEYLLQGYDGKGKYGPVREGSCKDAKLGIYVESGRADRGDENGRVGKTAWICTAKRGTCKAHHKSPQGRNERSTGETAQRRNREIQKEFRLLTFCAIADALSAQAPERADLNLVAFQLFERLGNYGDAPLKKALEWPHSIGGWNGKAALGKKIADWSEPELLRHLVLFAVAASGDLMPASMYSRGENRPAALLAVAARHKVDAAAILAEVKARREKKTKRIAAIGKAAKEAASQTPAKPRRGTCRICACTTAHACVLEFRGKGKTPKTCRWADASKTLCSNPECLRKAKAGKPSTAGGSLGALGTGSRPTAKDKKAKALPRLRPGPALAAKKGGRK